MVTVGGGVQEEATRDHKGDLAVAVVAEWTTNWMKKRV